MRNSCAVLVAALVVAGVVAGGCNGDSGATTKTETVTRTTAATTDAPATTTSTTTGAASTSSTDATTTSSLPDGDKPPASARCHTSQLSAHFVEGSPGAGQRYATLLLTNRERTPCSLYGFPGAQLIGASGTPVQTDIVRDRSRSSQPVTFVFDQQAKSDWHWTAIAGGDEPASGPCEPTPKTIRVTPPDETTSLEVAWPFGAVCGHGRIEVRPMSIVIGK